MREIPLTKGYVALVDDEDYERVSQHKWCANVMRKTVYGQRMVCRTVQMLHRFILGLEPGDKRQVDHRDRNGLNNCRSNLRVCTHAENQRNKDSNLNTSGYKGVYWSERSNKFGANIQVNGKTLHLGLFHDPITAALVRDKAARKLHGEFASLNFSGIEERQAA